MIKTEFESLLEKELTDGGISLGNRVYYEDFLVGADIDSIIAPIPAEYTYEMFESFSEYQKMLESDEPIPLFRRKAHGNCLEMIYDVHSNEAISECRNKIDNLIKEGRISCERIYVRKERTLLLDIYIEYSPKDEISVSMPYLDGMNAFGGNRILFKDDPYYLRNNLKEIRPLNGKKIKPKTLCEHIADLLLKRESKKGL